MRARYLKAVLRQDVGYFDLHVTSTAEVITSVSNDSLVIQDVLSEKVGSFNAAVCHMFMILLFFFFQSHWNEFISAGPKLLDERCDFLRELHSGLRYAVEASYCGLSLCRCSCDSWVDVRTDTDGPGEDDQGRVQ